MANPHDVQRRSHWVSPVPYELLIHLLFWLSGQVEQRGCGQLSFSGSESEYDYLEEVRSFSSRDLKMSGRVAVGNLNTQPAVKRILADLYHLEDHPGHERTERVRALRAILPPSNGCPMYMALVRDLRTYAKALEIETHIFVLSCYKVKH